MLKLLIVDDEPLILDGISSIIKRANIEFQQVETANDGIEALEKLESFGPDLLITDIHMPEMSGLELIRQAKTRNLCNRFIILTGFDEFEYARQALRYKVLDYLLKPIDKEELIAILEDAAHDIEMQVDGQNLEQKEEANPFRGLLDYTHFSDQVNRILGYIHMHYAKDISLELISEHIGINPSYVSALFKKETGINFIPYLHSCRIIKAQQLMESQPKLPLDKVALQVGYENPRQFFKVFKKYSGLTPGKYREVDLE
jgi:two-component system response regulator YesN